MSSTYHILTITITLLIIASSSSAATPSDRANALLKKMTLDEKLAMLHGYPGAYVGNIVKNTRLNIPTLTLEDGPQGVADGTKNTTAWPCVLNVVSTWDLNLMYDYGVAMGAEQRMKGTNIMLGPMLNLYRVPVDGRSFESIGEDPYLGGEFGVAVVKGIQSNNVIATIKHFIDNNQEFNRTSTSAEIDERTQYELYYEAFRKTIQYGSPGAVMCSYNKINGVYACENENTLTIGLKQHMNFTGFVMSDWGATHSTISSANNGLDVEMPADQYFGANLQAAVNNGSVTIDRINDMVFRIMLSMFQVGIFDVPQPTGNLSVNSQSLKHTELAQQLATAGAVLLKNEANTLPLKDDMSIGVVGDAASVNVIATGDGSGHVITPFLITPLEAIAKKVPNTQYASSSDIQKAITIAKEVDVVIFVVAVESSEGRDRVNLSLPNFQNELIQTVQQYAKKSVVIVNSPAAILMNTWNDVVDSILWMGYPGEIYGLSLVELLFGETAPSGKLPFTIPTTATQGPLKTVQQYPGVNNKAIYSEGLEIGYFYYNMHDETPLYPFGFGLSYTSFELSGLNIHANKCTCVLSNTGDVDGSEVVQMYIQYPKYANKPDRVLQGFQKVFVKQNTNANVEMYLNPNELRVWNTTIHEFSRIYGDFIIYVGTSSQHLPLSAVYTVSSE